MAEDDFKLGGFNLGKLIGFQGPIDMLNGHTDIDSWALKEGPDNKGLFGGDVDQYLRPAAQAVSFIPGPWQVAGAAYLGADKIAQGTSANDESNKDDYSEADMPKGASDAITGAAMSSGFGGLMGGGESGPGDGGPPGGSWDETIPSEFQDFKTLKSMLSLIGLDDSEGKRASGPSSPPPPGFATPSGQGGKAKKTGMDLEIA